MRCYDGCPDKDLQAVLDARAAAVAELKRLNPNAHVTYHHPAGFQAHEWGKPLSGFHRDIISACNEAVAKLARK
jgi:hypothetical protein